MNLIALILTAALGIMPNVLHEPADMPVQASPLTEMYVTACLDLWEKDSGLNNKAELLVFNFTNCNTLDGTQRALLMESVGEALGLKVREGNFAQLVDEGLIVYPDPEKQPHWCEFPTGLLISLEDAQQEDGSITFTLEKWRTPLGAYWLYDCTAISDDGAPESWTYTVGTEMIS